MKQTHYVLKASLISLFLSCTSPCQERRETISNMSFENAVVSVIEETDCWIDVTVIDQNGVQNKFDHCFCGLGDELDLMVGDTISKTEPDKFYNFRLNREFELNCCDH